MIRFQRGFGISPIMLPFIQTIQARFDTIKIRNYRMIRINKINE